MSHPLALPALLAALFMTVAVILAIRTVRLMKQAADAKFIGDFVRKFPGRCMICSYRDYGISHGYRVGPLEPHDCIEGNCDAAA